MSKSIRQNSNKVCFITQFLNIFNVPFSCNCKKTKNPKYKHNSVATDKHREVTEEPAKWNRPLEKQLNCKSANMERLFCDMIWAHAGKHHFSIHCIYMSFSHFPLYYGTNWYYAGPHVILSWLLRRRILYFWKCLSPHFYFKADHSKLPLICENHSAILKRCGILKNQKFLKFF